MGREMRSPHPESASFPLREVEFVVGMALLMALHALAIDVMLPALGEIARDLRASDPNERQLVIAVFLIGSGLASIMPGAVADRFGRKPVILSCLAAYFVISLVCAFVTSFETLLVLRGLMGVFTAGLIVMPMAVVRDRFSGDRMARTQSLVAMVFMVVPMLAPLVGQVILIAAGWRWIFAVMAILAFLLAVWSWFRLPETLHAEYRQAIALRTIASNMWVAITHRGSIGYIFSIGIIQGSLFGYVNSSQQLVGEALGAGLAFPVIFGGMAFAMVGTNFINAGIVERFGARRVSHAALLGFTLVAAAHLHFSLQDRHTLFTFVPLMTASMCFLSFIGANFQSIALQPFARIAGAASSVLSFARMMIGALLGLWIGQLFDGTPVPLSTAMFVSGLLSLLLVLYSERGRLFTRSTQILHEG